jgi:small subunit ribosomal protein S2
VVDYVIPGNDDALRAIRLFAAKVSDSVIEGQAMTKDSGAAPKVQHEEPEEEQTMGDIVAPFERTRAKRVDTAASDDEQVETPNEAAMR